MISDLILVEQISEIIKTVDCIDTYQSMLKANFSVCFLVIIYGERG